MILHIPRGDCGITYTFYLKQYVNGVLQAKNLTGYSCKLKMWYPGNSSNLLIDSACTVIDQEGGACTWTTIKGDTDREGEFSAEIEQTATGVVDSNTKFTIIIDESG